MKDASVIAVPTSSGGATLHAYLLRAPGSVDADPSVLVARANGTLAQHQRVATASSWPDADFPRTPTLKVRRHLLPMPCPDQHIEVDTLAASDDPVHRRYVALPAWLLWRRGSSLPSSEWIASDWWI